MPRGGGADEALDDEPGHPLHTFHPSHRKDLRAQDAPGQAEQHVRIAPVELNAHSSHARVWWGVEGRRRIVSHCGRWMRALATAQAGRTVRAASEVRRDEESLHDVGVVSQRCQTPYPERAWRERRRHLLREERHDGVGHKSDYRHRPKEWAV